MTAEKSTIEGERYSHPIEPEIVEEVAEKQGVNEFYLHEILQRMQDFWEPNRDLLESVAYRLYNHSNMDTYPDRSVGSEYTVFRGEHLTPSDIFARIEKDGVLSDTYEHPVEWGIAVEIAHRRQAEEIGNGPGLHPFVVK